MHVHLVDGTYELFRAYFGAPSALSPAGAEVGATRAFLRSILSLLQDTGATHVACAFDTVVESFRNDLFDGYKTGEGIEPELFTQFPLAERAAKALGVTVWSMHEFEADDALAAGAWRYAQEQDVERIWLCTPDKDLAQCVVQERIVLWDRMRERIYDDAAVREKWGVPPAGIADWLALVGDSADGIPGIARWGAKSTAAVLSHYGSIEAIPEDLNTWEIKVRGAAALSRNLNAERDNAALYNTLATLRTDVPLQESLEQLHWRGADRVALQALCDEIGETRLMARVRTWCEPD